MPDQAGYIRALRFRRPVVATKPRYFTNVITTRVFDMFVRWEPPPRGHNYWGEFNPAGGDGAYVAMLVESDRATASRIRRWRWATSGRFAPRRTLSTPGRLS